MRLATIAAALVMSSSCHAATVSMDISDQAGFTRSGASGTMGNGFLWISPKYLFEPGTTVDFGTAFVIGDPTDHRAPCGGATQPLCGASMGSLAWEFLTDGQGGIPSWVSDLFHGSCLTTTDYCQPTVFRLLFTLGPSNDGIQLAFQGASLNIVPIPLPATLLLFLTGLLAVGVSHTKGEIESGHEG